MCMNHQKLWPLLILRLLPLLSAKVRPRTATLSKSTKPLAGLQPVEYKLHGTGLLVERPASAANGGPANAGAPPNNVGPGGAARLSSPGTFQPATAAAHFDSLRVR